MFKLREPVLNRFGINTLPFQLPEISIGFAILLLVFFLLGFIFYASLYAAVGASVNTEQEAQQAVQPMLILLVATAIFINPILLNPTGQLATVMSLLPFSAPIIMPLRLALVTVPWYELVGSHRGSGALVLGRGVDCGANLSRWTTHVRKAPQSEGAEALDRIRSLTPVDTGSYNRSTD
jgi:ABC-2 type transport system permease protein